MGNASEFFGIALCRDDFGVLQGSLIADVLADIG